MTISETKLKYFGLIKAAAKTETKLDLQDVSDELNVSVARLRTWAKEFQESEEAENILHLLDVSELLIDRVVTEVIQEASFEIDETTGEIIATNTEELYNKPESKDILAFKDQVTGLQALNQEVQAAAGMVAKKVLKKIKTADDDMSPKDLKSLADAITGIQNAFFNKPQTNVQVNMAVGESSLLNNFRNNMKS